MTTSDWARCILADRVGLLAERVRLAAERPTPRWPTHLLLLGQLLTLLILVMTATL